MIYSEPLSCEKENAAKTLKYDKRHKDDQPLISCKSNEELKRETLTFEIFRIKFVFPIQSCCLHVFSYLSRPWSSKKLT